MTTRRILLLSFGSVAVLVALVLLVGGGLALWVDSQRDDDGFFTTSSEPFETTSFAIVSDNLDVASDAPGWLFGSGRFGDIRLTASGSGAERAAFLGIGEEDAVAAYLGGVERDVVTDVNFDPFDPTYRREAGGRVPGPPGDETLWDASVQGTGTQTLQWTVEQGNWTIVVMNANGSRGVSVDLEVGANIGFVRGIGIGLLAAGILLLLGGATMIFLGARGGQGEPPAAVPGDVLTIRDATASDGEAPPPPEDGNDRSGDAPPPQ